VTGLYRPAAFFVKFKKNYRYCALRVLLCINTIESRNLDLERKGLGWEVRDEMREGWKWGCGPT